MPFRIDFKDIEIAGDRKSWTSVLRTCGPREIIAALVDAGLTLNCDGGARHPDTVQCDEWDEDACHGRVLRGGTQLIGRIRITHITQAEADALACAPTLDVAAAAIEGGASDPDPDPDGVHELPAADTRHPAPSAEDWMAQCRQLGLRRGFGS